MISEGFSFVDHINELRARLRVVALCLLVILLFVVFFPVNPVYQVQHLGQYLNLQFVENTITATFVRDIHNYLVPPNWVLIAGTGIGEGMEVFFIAALLLTLGIGSPIIAYEAYKFIDPALNEKERKLIYPFIITSSVLFATGLLFGYFVIAKFLVIALGPFLTATGISPQIDGAAFYYVVFLLIVSTGAAFTAPVFVYSLIKLRILEADFFSRNRLVIWFVVWVVTGLFLTPDGGPLLDVVIFVPIVSMIEIAVWLGRRSTRNDPAKLPPPGSKCRYCGGKLTKGRPFCPNCGLANT